MERDVRVIKRYSNRKLYDTKESRYVTLDEIAGFLKEGCDVRILDRETGEDLTAVVLAQIIVEMERRQRTFPLSVLRRLIEGKAGSIEDLHLRVDEQVRKLAEALSPVLKLQRLYRELRQRVEGMEARLERLEARLGASEHNGGQAETTVRDGPPGHGV